jgi:Retroviral aspartyl protease.
MEHNTKITVPFVDCNSGIPMIAVKVGGIDTNAIIDTGAESTLASEGMIELPGVSVVEEDLTADFTGIGDYKKNNISQLNVETTIGDQVFMVSGYEFDMSSVTEHFELYRNYNCTVALILGSDFLAKYDVVIDYEKRTVTMTI